MITHEEPTHKRNEVKVTSDNQIASTLINIDNNSTKTDTSDDLHLVTFALPL
jgi:hypothetical protein